MCACVYVCARVLLLDAVVVQPWFLSVVFANTLWLVALAQYVYITFLGYSGAPSSTHTQRESVCVCVSVCLCLCLCLCLCVCVSACVCLCRQSESKHAHSHQLTRSHSLTHSHSLTCTHRMALLSTVTFFLCQRCLSCERHRPFCTQWCLCWWCTFSRCCCDGTSASLPCGCMACITQRLLSTARRARKWMTP